MSVTVFLANKGFTLPVTELDERRREAYFKNPADPKNTLMPEEDAILLALGINKENATVLMPHLAKFFKQLPKCQSDSNLVLAKDCEIVQYVLWETLFAARARSKEMYEENWKTKKPWASISVAINQQIINDLKPKPESINDMDRLFTLILKAAIPVEETIVEQTEEPEPEPVSEQASAADALFTLILPGKVEEEPEEVVPSPPASTVIPTAPAPSVVSNDSTLSPTLGIQTIELTRPLDRASLEKAQEIVANQCGTKAIPDEKDRVFELPLDGHKRSLYFWHCIKNKNPIDLEVASLSDEEELTFVQEWTNAVKNAENSSEASQEFLGIDSKEQSYIDHLFLYFEKGGPNDHFLKCKGCTKLGESWSGSLNRFIPRIGLSDANLEYLLENIQWNAVATVADAKAPKTVNEIGLFIMDTERYESSSDFETWFTIVTTHDVDYSFNKGRTWNYSLQGSHIHESKVIRDLFESKTAVADIHPWLMYLLNKERDVQRPVTDGSTRSLDDWFLKNAFDDNYSPVKDPRYSLTKRLYASTKEQLHIAYFVICHAIANADISYIPASFYSRSNYNTKLPIIVGWLRDTNTDYSAVEDGMKWVAPGTKPLPRGELAKLFERSGKKTLKKNYNDSNRSKSWSKNAKGLMTRAPGAPSPEETEWSGTATQGAAPEAQNNTYQARQERAAQRATELEAQVLAGRKPPPNEEPPIEPKAENGMVVSKASTEEPVEVPTPVEAPIEAPVEETEEVEENLSGKRCRKEYRIFYDFMIANRKEIEVIPIADLAKAFSLIGEGSNKVFTLGGVGVIRLRKAMVACHPDKNEADIENTNYIIKVLNQFNDYDPNAEPETVDVDPREEERAKAEEKAAERTKRWQSLKERMSKMFSYIKSPFTRKNRKTQPEPKKEKKQTKTNNGNRRFRETYNRLRASGMDAGDALKAAEEEQRAQREATRIKKPTTKIMYGNKKPNLSGISSNKLPPEEPKPEAKAEAEAEAEAEPSVTPESSVASDTSSTVDRDIRAAKALNVRLDYYQDIRKNVLKKLQRTKVQSIKDKYAAMSNTQKEEYLRRLTKIQVTKQRAANLAELNRLASTGAV